MSARSVKTRRAPSRHFRDARVYDHTTTAMHNNEHTPSLPSLTISSTFRRRKVDQEVYAKTVMELIEDASRGPGARCPQVLFSCV